MPDEPFLRESAREAIQSGQLPAHPPDRTLGGRGGDETCPICGDPIKRDQSELEIEFDRPTAMLGVDRYHLHSRCFAAWELERTKVHGGSI